MHFFGVKKCGVKNFDIKNSANCYDLLENKFGNNSGRNKSGLIIYIDLLYSILDFFIYQ